MNLYTILINTTDQALEKQLKDGSMSPGDNGPHQHPETPIRNTCHWLITFLKVYEATNEKKYLDAANKSIDYLLRQKKKFRYNYQFRNQEGADKCNGLIGPAWGMEAFLTAGLFLKRQDLIKVASEIFMLHNVDEQRGLWYVREVDGKIRPIDRTFNHQLWFAVMGSIFDKKEYPEISRKVTVFIKNLDKNFVVFRNGLIRHPLVSMNSPIWQTLNNIRKKGFKEEKLKSVGYQSFNLYAFAILKENYPNIPFWNSTKFKKALKYIETDDYKEALEDNVYGFPYNVTGIEIAYVLQIFKKESKNLQKYWLEEQFKRHYNFEENCMNRNTPDPNTLAARIYEATRLKDIELDVK
jgi:hypothetical protein